MVPIRLEVRALGPFVPSINEHYSAVRLWVGRGLTTRELKPPSIFLWSGEGKGRSKSGSACFVVPAGSHRPEERVGGWRKFLGNSDKEVVFKD